jgi:hypothetical protein
VYDIPDEVSGSWYTGVVMVMFKEGAFEVSSPIRHSIELAKVIDERIRDKSVVSIYLGGGQDHRVHYKQFVDVYGTKISKEHRTAQVSKAELFIVLSK